MSTGTGPSNGGADDVASRPPEPTVMVAGAVGRLLWVVGAELFDGRVRDEEGAVVVTTRESPAVVTRRLVDRGPLEADNLAVVDARGTGTADPDVGVFSRVDPRAGPGALDDAVADGIDALADRGVERTHFLFDTLATGYRLPAPEVTYDRAHELAMTVGTETGIGVFTADTTRLPDETVDELAHLVDVRVDLRRPDRTTELRWTGLLDGSDGWLALDDVELKDGAFR